MSYTHTHKQQGTILIHLYEIARFMAACDSLPVYKRHGGCAWLSLTTLLFWAQVGDTKEPTQTAEKALVPHKAAAQVMHPGNQPNGSFHPNLGGDFPQNRFAANPSRFQQKGNIIPYYTGGISPYIQGGSYFGQPTGGSLPYVPHANMLPLIYGQNGPIPKWRQEICMPCID